MFSEASGEKFVFRVRTGPSCPSETLQNAIVWTPWESRNNDWDGAWSCLWCVSNKRHIFHEPCVRSHRFCMTTNPPPWISVLLWSHQCEVSKSPGKLGWLEFSLLCFASHTPSHVTSEVCTFTYALGDVCQRRGPHILHSADTGDEHTSDNEGLLG